MTEVAWPQTVWIVEDVAEMGELMKLVFEGRSGEVRLFSSGREARERLLRDRPDLLLLDEVLPGEASGDTLAEFAQAGVPIVLMTGMADRQAPVPSEALGRLAKPHWKNLEPAKLALTEMFKRLTQPGAVR